MGQRVLMTVDAIGGVWTFALELARGLTADGGEESVCGWLKDKFGFSWQVVPSMLRQLGPGDPAKEKAVAEAIFSMKKLDIAALRRAYDSA